MAFALLATVGATLGPGPVRGQAGVVVRPPAAVVPSLHAMLTTRSERAPPPSHPYRSRADAGP